MTRQNDSRPLVVHVMYRFDVGGMENGIVNLINHMPADTYRHAIVALTKVTDFCQRIVRDDVEFFGLDKPPGHTLWVYPQLYRLFQRLRPAIVHTRNLGALEVAVPAWAAGVPVRIHGEHGWDVGDLDGSSRKYRWVRRLYRPFVTFYIALSRDLGDYLTHAVGIPAERVERIYNGVDTARFQPVARRRPISGCPFNEEGTWIVGTVGRMQTVKNQTDLAQAFIRAVQTAPALRQRLRLVMVGDGPLRNKAQSLLEQAGCADLAWLPGGRNDVPDILRGLDCFVLPSLAEGISNTILEAMACGLPVIATDVGGNAELIDAGTTGTLVAAGDVPAMAAEIERLSQHEDLARTMGQAGRRLVEQKFSMDTMVRRYQSLYDRSLGISTQERLR